jgi:hypothetical protein
MVKFGKITDKFVSYRFKTALNQNIVLVRPIKLEYLEKSYKNQFMCSNEPDLTANPHPI